MTFGGIGPSRPSHWEERSDVAISAKEWRRSLRSARNDIKGGTSSLFEQSRRVTGNYDKDWVLIAGNAAI